MAQKVTVSMVDDTDWTPAAQTVEFALDGVNQSGGSPNQRTLKPEEPDLGCAVGEGIRARDISCVE